MTEIIIHQIENKTKVEALIGIGIMSLITLLGERIWSGEPIPIELFWGLAILLGAYVALVVLTYVKFYIQKIVYLKEEKTKAEIQMMTLDKEIRKLEITRDIAELEAK